MAIFRRARERHEEQEQERDLIRALRRAVTRAVLQSGHFERMRAVIPRWLEWVCTGSVAADPQISDLIDRRLAETDGLEEAIQEDWS